MTEENQENVTPNETNAADKTVENDVNFSEEELEFMDEETSKKLKTAIEQKKHWRDKFEKQAQELEKLRTTQPVKEEKKEVTTPAGEPDKFTLLELKVEHPDLKMDLIKKAVAYAKVEGSSPEEVIKSSYFKAMVSEEARKDRVEGATTESSSRSGSGSISFEKIAADETGESYRKLDSEKRAEFREYLKSNDSSGGLKFMKR